MSTPQLYWLGPDGQENTLPLVAAEILIGRKGDADVVLNNQHVSRHHAKLVKTNDGYICRISEARTARSSTNRESNNSR
jgi:pSer/pThr/pTyr-binding forkhead associated (FHA) protein